MALEYIEKALHICFSENHPPGRSYLNSGAIYSVMGKFFLAFENTKNAIISLRRELGSCEYKQKRELSRMIILAYYNVSVLEENLEMFRQSLVSLENALVLSESIFGIEDGMTLELAKELEKRTVILKRKKLKQMVHQ